MRKRNTDRGEEEDLKRESLLFVREGEKKKDKEDFYFGLFFFSFFFSLQAVRIREKYPHNNNNAARF